MAVIGITTCRKIEDYRQAILHVGGEPRLLDPSMPLDEALAGIDGLMLTGGDDVTPSRYGEAPHPATVEAEAGPRRVRDRADRRGARARAADLRDLPRRPGAERRLRRHAGAGHPVAAPRRARAQPAGAAAPGLRPRARGLDREGLAAGDADARAADRRRLRSEQPPSSGGEGRRARASASSATAPDGVIEAIEDPAARFCLGVQWHPENFFRTGEFRPLFEGFLEAAQKPIPDDDVA